MTGKIITFFGRNLNFYHIFSYRIEHIFDDNILQMPKNIRKYILHKKLIYAVYVHRRAIESVL